VLGVLCGTVLALGAASAAQAGQGPLPVGVIGESITAGGSHTCAIKTDGAPVCWGNTADLGVRARYFVSAPGPRDPVAGNDTDEGRDRNRRVTIEITHSL
jgi:Regulator of chromosome condensation (RCC1) repeat